MSHYVQNAELLVYSAANDSSTADFAVRQDDIISISLDEKLSDRIDSGSVRIDNAAGRYMGVEQSGLAWNENGYNTGGYGGDFLARLTTGDRIELHTQLEGEGSLSRLWTGIVAKPVSIDRLTDGNNVLDVPIADFVTWVLSQRYHSSVYVDAQIAGASTSILNQMLEETAEEIDRSQIGTVPETTTVEADYRKALDIVRDLADRGDAVIGHDDTALTFDTLDSKTSEFTATRGTDYGAFSVSPTGEDVRNAVRVIGGRDKAVDDEQTTQDDFQTVTESSRLTFQLDTRKSEIVVLELFTQATGSGETIQARIQKDDSGAPIAVGEEESDIASTSLQPTDDEFVDGGYSTFRFPDHTLPEPNPWIIVQTDGSTGQDIGENASASEPAFKAYFPFPVVIEKVDGASINSFRRREGKVKRKNVTELATASDIADSVLAHDTTPEREFAARALSDRMRDLAPGDVVTLDEPTADVSGDYIVTKKTYAYEGVRITTDIVLQDVSSV